jgi:methionine-S-sulfoxide reductase
MSPYSLQEEAVFAAGSFWEAEDAFARMRGVISTDVGYTGGSTGQPTFHDLGDNVEAIRVYFDQRIISYEELLDKFWSIHDASAEMDGRYGSRIYYASEEQRRIANSAIAMKKERGEEILTTVEPLGRFWDAEDYHQHYLARLRGEL